MTRWENVEGRVLTDVWLAVFTEGDDVQVICGEPDPGRPLGGCNRAPEHAGRHIAIGAQAAHVYAAWPGTHEPTLADLDAVTS